MSDPISDPVADRSGPRASFGVRLVAAVIDGVVFIIVSAIVGGIVGSNGSQAVVALLGLAYYVYLEGSPSGQTLGKRAMNIRVIDLDGGGSIGYGRAAIRYLGRFVSTVVCLLGYFWMLWDDQKQTWHDKFANTVVVPTSAYPVSSWPG